MYASRSEIAVVQTEIEEIAKTLTKITEVTGRLMTIMQSMVIKIKHLEEEAAWNKHDNGDEEKYPLAPDLD